MGFLVRLFEKITGRPHRHDDAAMVSAAAHDLTDSIRELSATLRPYNEKNDPLVALMRDVLNNRRRGRRENGKPELHS